jgi:RNA polymerase sigma-70 factor (ECF subfamily)
MVCPTIVHGAGEGAGLSAGLRAGQHPRQREAQFDVLYEEHQQSLHAFLLGRTGDPELALDLLQESFTRAWRNLDTLLGLPSSRQRAWLFAIGRNLVIDQYRSRATRTATQGALEAATRLDAAVSESAERTVERESELRLIDAAMQGLPDDLRTVLVLQVLGEQTSSEIGSLLGRPAGTVRYQLSRARKLLAEEIGRLESAPDPTIGSGVHVAVPLESALSPNAPLASVPPPTVSLESAPPPSVPLESTQARSGPLEQEA